MHLIASGRDSDVFEYDDGLVLRRYRDGRPAEREAATMRALGELGSSRTPGRWSSTGRTRRSGRLVSTSR